MEVFASDDYLSWINDLKDRAGTSRVLIRVDRLIHGNPGLHRNLTHGYLRILNTGSWLLMTLQTISARLKRWRHILTYGLMNSRMMCLG